MELKRLKEILPQTIQITWMMANDFDGKVLNEPRQMVTQNLRWNFLRTYGDSKTILENEQEFIDNWNAFLAAYEPEIAKLLSVELYKYNPLWNVDGVETETNVKSGNAVFTKDGKSVLSDSGDDITVKSGSELKKGSDIDTLEFTGKETETRTPNLTKTDSVSAFNTQTFSPNEQNTETGTETNEKSFDMRQDARTIDYDSRVEYDDVTDKTTFGKTTTNSFQNYAETTTYNDVTESLTKVRTGNIGVTMTQQLLTAEMQLSLEFPIDKIIKKFVKEISFFSDSVDAGRRVIHVYNV